MKQSRWFKLLLTSVLLGVFILPVFSGCTTHEQPDYNNADTPEAVAKSKQVACGRLDARLAELKTLLEYRTTFIEREVENTKTQISNATTIAEVERLERLTYQNVNAYVLSDEEILQIKQAYLGKYSSTGKTIDDVELLYYFGNYDGKYAAIIKGDAPNVEGHYIIGNLVFDFPVEVLSIYSGVKYYHIVNAYSQGVITDAELASLHEKNMYVFDGFSWGD